MNVFSLSANEETIKKIEEDFLPYSSSPPHEAMSFFAKNKEVTLSIYFKQDKEGRRKVVFSGKKGEEFAKKYGFCGDNEQKEGGFARNMYPQIGSDEVGTGDFFGPVCVVASYVKKEDLTLLEKLGIQDSKKMDDKHILEIGPELIKAFPYSSLSLLPAEYNEVHRKYNMNAIKAKMHDQALKNLASTLPHSAVYMDQFAPKDLYYSYLKNVDGALENIIFSTKGESLYPSVALSSVIARYSFLRKMAQMGEEYGVTFPLGASDAVTEFAKKFADQFGIDELEKVAKISFANYRKLTELI